MDHGLAAGLEELDELRLVLGLRVADDVVAVVFEVEPDDVQLLRKGRLDVLLPVDALLRQLLTELREKLLASRESPQQAVYRLPLRAVRVSRDFDVDGCARGRELRAGGKVRRALLAAAARGGQHEAGKQADKR